MKLFRDESGKLIIEMAIYFPFLLMTWLIFIMGALFLTQGVVLDRAVARAATEGAAWLSNNMRIHDQPDAFYGGNIGIRTNPYVNTVATAFNPFHPVSREDFIGKIESLVKEYASWSVTGGYAGDLEIDVQYNNYVVAGDLIVTAKQRIRMPIVLTPAPSAQGWHGIHFHTSSRARVIQHGSVINDVNFMLDGLRLVGLDVSKLRGFIGGVPENADGWLKQLTSPKEGSN
jgi:hypothetical protein